MTIYNNSPICSLNQFKSIEDEWNKVYSESTINSPFLSYDYLIHWYGCFTKPSQVRIYRVEKDGKTIGFLPLRLYKNNFLRILTSLTNDHCLHGHPLIPKSHEAVFSQLILTELIKDADNWDILRFSFSYSFVQVQDFLCERLLSKHKIHFQKFIQPTFSVLLNKSFKSYFYNDLSPNTRKNFLRYRNRLLKNGSLELLHLQGNDAVKSWPEFTRIEGSGWKGRAHSSINKIGTNYQLYYKGLVPLLAKTNTLSIYFLLFKTSPLQGYLVILKEIHTTGLKPAMMKRLKSFPHLMYLLFILLST